MSSPVEFGLMTDGADVERLVAGQHNDPHHLLGAHPEKDGDGRDRVVIRAWRPDLVITMQPLRTKNLYASHRDHRTIAGVVLDCIYPLARDHMAFPELMPEYEPHKVREVHLMQWDDPDVVVDISEVIDLKLKALACHQSQFKDFAGVEERVRERAAELGKPKNYAFAEAFDRILMPR